VNPVVSSGKVCALWPGSSSSAREWPA
jgi:hypothetical protein